MSKSKQSHIVMAETTMPEDYPLKNWLGKIAFALYPKRMLRMPDDFARNHPGHNIFELLRQNLKDQRVKKNLTIGALCEISYASVFISMPLLISPLVDTIAEKGIVSLQEVQKLAFIAMTLMGIGAILNFLGVRRTDLARGMIEVQNRRQVTLWAMGHSAGWFSVREAGQIAHRVAEISRQMDTIFGLIAYHAIPTSTYLIGSAIILSTLDPVLAITFCVWTLAFIFLSMRLGVISSQFFRRLFRKRTDASGLVTDMVINNNLVRLFASEKSEDQRLASIGYKAYERYMQSATWACTKNIIRDFMMLILLGGMITLMGQRFITGAITAGEFASSMGILFVVVSQVRSLHHIIRDIMENAGSVQESLGEIGTPHDVEDIGTKVLESGHHDIHLQGVSFNYENTQNVLSDINLNIPFGQKVGVVGHSGAGKSTLTALLLRLWDASEGKITIGNHDIRDFKMDTLRSQIALIPQDTTMFHRSLMDNIRYGRMDATDAEVIEAAKRAHADEFIRDLPDGYETMVGERGVKLSGGQRQRIAIARAILKDAPILILDEATSALDSESEKLIQESLKELMEGKTVIAIAHRLSTIAHLDRLIVMEQGRIVEEGTHNKLRLKKDGIYASLWGMQSGGFLGE